MHTKARREELGDASTPQFHINPLSYDDGHYYARMLSADMPADVLPYSHATVVGNLVTLGNAAEIGVPKAGMVGDVQEDPFENTFSYDPSIVSKTLTTVEAKYTSQQPGIVRSSFFEQLPVQTSQRVYTGYFSYDDLVGVIASAMRVVPSVRIAITVDKSYTISKTITAVSPAGYVERIAGCFDCTEGYSLNVSLIANGHAGVILVSSKYCSASSLAVEREYAYFTLRCYADTANVHDSLILQGSLPTDTAHIDYSGTLSRAVKITNTTTTETVGVTPKGDDAFNWMFELGWQGILFWIAIGIVALVVLGILGRISLGAWRSYSSSKMLSMKVK